MIPRPPPKRSPAGGTGGRRGGWSLAGERTATTSTPASPRGRHGQVLAPSEVTRERGTKGAPNPGVGGWAKLRARQALWAFGKHQPATSRVTRAHRLSGAETIVDVGCGHGADLRALRCDGHRGLLIGVDCSVGMLAELETTAADPVLADAGALPLASGTAEVVLAMHMLYHLDDTPAALGEFRRVLRQDTSTNRPRVPRSSLGRGPRRWSNWEGPRSKTAPGAGSASRTGPVPSVAPSAPASYERWKGSPRFRGTDRPGLRRLDRRPVRADDARSRGVEGGARPTGRTRPVGHRSRGLLRRHGSGRDLHLSSIDERMHHPRRHDHTVRVTASPSRVLVGAFDLPLDDPDRSSTADG